jgi:hypothetical protein
MASQAEDHSWNSWCHESLKICTPLITCFIFISFCSVTIKAQETNSGTTGNNLILCTGIIQMSIMPLNMTAVMECPVGCRLSMQYSYNYWGNDRRDTASSSSSHIKPVETSHGYHNIEFFHLLVGIIESFFWQAIRALHVKMFFQFLLHCVLS